jgi:hypothetical protein
MRYAMVSPELHKTIDKIIQNVPIPRKDYKLQWVTSVTYVIDLMMGSYVVTKIIIINNETLLH